MNQSHLKGRERHRLLQSSGKFVNQLRKLFIVLNDTHELKAESQLSFQCHC